MVFKRFKRFVKRVFRRRPTYSQVSNSKIARIAKSVAYKQVARSKELKFLEYPFAPTTLPNVGWYNITPLTQIIQGLTANQRIGDKIRLKYVNFRMSITKHAASTLANQIVRVLILWDKQQDSLGGMDPNTYLTRGTGYFDIATVKEDYQDRFKIMYNKRVNLIPDMPTKNVIINYNFRDRLVDYDGSNPNTYPKTGSFYIVILSNENGVNQPTFAADISVYFVDI